MDLVFHDAADVEARTPYPALVEAMATLATGALLAPPRLVHHVPSAGEPDRRLMLMPAWTEGGRVGVKLITLSPNNPSRGHSATNGLYILFDEETGAPRAILDATTLTARRTAAVAALATERLAAPDAARHLVIGTGRLALETARSITGVRPLRETVIWGRDPVKARAVAESVGGRTATGLAEECAQADIITAVTNANEPLVCGAKLAPGCHVNLVGSFRPDMRESDGDLLARADRVFVDDREGAPHEAGDLIAAASEGRFDWADLAGDLAAVAAFGRSEREAAEITVFKSVGSPAQDLAAAMVCMASEG